MAANFLVNSSGSMSSNFVDVGGTPTTPTTTAVTVYDPFWQIVQVSDNTTISVPMTGTVTFTILAPTFYIPGVFILRWLAIMPDGTQTQFDLPVTVDTEIV